MSFIRRKLFAGSDLGGGHGRSPCALVCVTVQDNARETHHLGGVRISPGKREASVQAHSFHHKRHPAQMGKAEVPAFLTHLAVDGQVSSSTQNQALSALLFLYRAVLEQEFHWLDDVVRAKCVERAYAAMLFCASPYHIVQYPRKCNGIAQQLVLQQDVRTRVRPWDVHVDSLTYCGFCNNGAASERLL